MMASHHLDQVDAVALGEEAPLVHEGQDRGAIGILDDLAGLALDGTVEHGERKLVDVEHIRQEGHDPLAGLGIDAAAHAPEIPDGGHVVAARHHPLEGVGQQRLAVAQAALLELFLDDRIGHVLGGAGRHRGFDQNETAGIDLFADDPETLLQGGDVGVPLADIAEGFLVVVALNIDDDHIGEVEDIVGEGGDQVLFLLDAAPNQGRYLRILGLHGSNAAVQVRDLPVGPC